jgi:hypothetical protein
LAKLNIKRFTDRAEAEAHYLREVDRIAEAERAKHITSGQGQAMIYDAKHREALSGDGPLLRAESGALDATVAEVAASVLAARARWEQAVAKIEAVRLKAKAAIREASTAADMRRIVTAFTKELSA